MKKLLKNGMQYNHFLWDTKDDGKAKQVVYMKYVVGRRKKKKQFLW
jgi:hypothetical protein